MYGQDKEENGPEDITFRNRNPGGESLVGR